MLKLINISKTFSSGTNSELKVLDDLNLEITQGENTVILGSNGSGKSTLFRIIAGNIMPDTGSVFLNNSEITKLPAYRRADRIYYIHQSREKNLVSNLTLLEIFMLGMSRGNSDFKTLKRKAWQEKIVELLKTYGIGLEKRTNEQVNKLSGGEHQIASLVLATEMIKGQTGQESLLLLDEHVAHLDPKSAEKVLELTSKLVKKNSITTLMVTHNISIAANYGDRILILKNRKIEFDKYYNEDVKKDRYELLQLM